MVPDKDYGEQKSQWLPLLTQGQLFLRMFLKGGSHDEVSRLFFESKG